MDIPDFTVSLKCLFCGEALEGPEDAEYKSGDLIKCTKCGEENDYDSVFEVAQRRRYESSQGKGRRTIAEAIQRAVQEIALTMGSKGRSASLRAPEPGRWAR